MNHQPECIDILAWSILGARSSSLSKWSL